MNTRKKALIIGQDGANLAESLLGKGYKTHSIEHRASLFNTDRNLQAAPFFTRPINIGDEIRVTAFHAIRSGATVLPLVAVAADLTAVQHCGATPVATEALAL